MKTPLLIAALLLLPWHLLAESARDARHAKIRQKQAAHKNLAHPYFAPSVHIGYRHPDRRQTYLAYYNEIRVRETTKHTYFCTVGFDVGYLGIQDHGRGPLAIFSVWDKGGGQNDSRKVAEADRTQVLYSNPKAKSSRFGGEGSGAKTMMPYQWELDKTYSFLLQLTPLESGTIYTAWIAEKGQAWIKIASYQTVVTKKKLRGFYSFVEDYARNGTTGQKRRLAYYPLQAVMTADGKWQQVTNGSGTIADDLIQNGHSGVKDNLFFSQSGADTADYGTMPRQFSVPAAKPAFEMPELPDDFGKTVKTPAK